MTSSLDCRVPESNTAKPERPPCCWPMGPAEKHPQGPEGRVSHPCEGPAGPRLSRPLNHGWCKQGYLGSSKFISQGQGHGVRAHEESRGGLKSGCSPVSGAQGDDRDDPREARRSGRSQAAMPLSKHTGRSSAFAKWDPNLRR